MTFFADFKLVQTSLHFDKRMTCDFASFSIVFQLYQDDGWMIMKRFVQWNLVYVWKIYHLEQGSNSGPLDQYTSRDLGELYSRKNQYYPVLANTPVTPTLFSLRSEDCCQTDSNCVRTEWTW